MILQFLIHHILTHGLMLAATATMGLSGETSGALITGDGSGGEGDASQETDTGEGETDEGQGSGESTSQSQGGDGKQQTQSSKETQVDWKTIPPEVSTHLKEIAKTNPQLANKLQNAVYTANNFLKEIPGGIKEIRALKTSIDELGGIDQIRTQAETYRNLVEEQETLDDKARQGDASVLDTFAEIAGDGFSKLMPAAMNRWANQDKDSYSHEMSKIMVNAMREGGMVADLNLAFRMLKLNTPEATKEAMECLNRCAEWANGINTIAAKVPVKPAVDPQIAKGQQELEAGRTKLFNDQFSSDFGSWRNSKIQEVVSPLTNGKTLNDYQMRTLGERIVTDIKMILTADPQYMKNLNRLYAARDMAELQKFARSRTEKLLPEVAKKAYRSLFSGSGSSKKTTKPVTQNSATTTVQTAPVKGWTKVTADKAPAPDLIDGKKTDFKMKFNKQAILKDGSKLYWGDKVPA